MPPVHQPDLANVESPKFDKVQVVLEIVDRIVRSSACHGKQAENRLMDSLLELLAKLELSLYDDSPAETFEEASNNPPRIESASDCDHQERTLCDLLQHLSSFQQHRQDLAVIRHAAHQAIAYRELQKRFDQQLEKAKLQSIYNIAYGLSHELNNPLANIASRAGLLRPSVKDSQHGDLVQAIVDNAMRASEMLGDLMLIARPPQPTAEDVSLDELGSEFIERSSDWASRRGVIVHSTWSATGKRLFDRAMLIEAGWCLVRNAIEASSPNSTVEIHGDLSHARLSIEVLDNGPGLSNEALQNCFDPFYSGREAGRGLGLGLSKAKRFAELMHGDIQISNRAGRGCRAVVWIPVESNS